MLTRDDLIKEYRSRRGSLTTVLLVYLLLVATMVSTALLIM